MSFVPIIFGKKDWDSNHPLASQYGGIYCPNCHNFQVTPVKRREFISFWFIPVFPIFWGNQLHCPVCNWRQDFKTEDQLKKVQKEQQKVRQ
ncbi:unnamed protein product [Kluyveromyces dobzhanskii CBS 2104]|uniref:WGS project CCBQ000000000 data, contig 00012 n=1 Tax=Kluyveromyces dobzhanskii CBS 2104 TaxID=1427455 RepID=A0A0A8L2V2_9SACH|nr:unnamed protein product [Kluyveromyces dobzhanskii CBS 2104]